MLKDSETGKGCPALRKFLMQEERFRKSEDEVSEIWGMRSCAVTCLPWERHGVAGTRVFPEAVTSWLVAWEYEVSTELGPVGLGGNQRYISRSSTFCGSEHSFATAAHA